MLQFDVTIIGSGIVGATAALILAKHTSLKIAVLDAQAEFTPWQENKMDHRVSAISLASQRIFKKINVWDKIVSKRVSKYLTMHVWEEIGSGEIHFDCKTVGASALGYIIEDSATRTSLLETFSEHSNLHLFHPVQLSELDEESDQIKLYTADNQVFSTKLLIAADGANSWVREKTGIKLKIRDYKHTAIVATVSTELSHEATARQRFLTSGPLAFLPLQAAHQSSIVWSTSHQHAEILMAQDEVEFAKSLTRAFEAKLGNINQISRRHVFPLNMRHAENYVKARVALIGDAAHTIHPLAGQGVNLGLLDAACLTEVISDAITKQKDFASFAQLRRYERWRKSDNVGMLTAVEGLKYVFMSDKKIISTLRNIGLYFTNKTPLLKNFFIRYALGVHGDLPRIAS